MKTCNERFHFSLNGNDINQLFDNIGSGFERTKFTFLEAAFGNMAKETGDLMFSNEMRLQLFELSNGLRLTEFDFSCDIIFNY